ncbi:MAG TPA: protein translocase subunit SecD [candidate division Zixibacteria bacterium]|nr:protein translocase subunit SecD [candidate division Zixibacteria bacterium]
MRRTETVRIVAIAVILIASFFFLLPSIRLLIMSEEEKAAMRRTDPEGYVSLVRQSIKLGLDLQGGLRLVLEPDVADLSSAGASNAADQALTIISNRIYGMGTIEPEIRKRKNNQIVVEIPGIDSISVADAKKQISQIAKLEFRFLETPTVTDQTVEKIDAVMAAEFGTDLDTAQELTDTAAVETDTAVSEEAEAEEETAEMADTGEVEEGEQETAMAEEEEAKVPIGDTAVVDLDQALEGETSLSAYLMPAERSAFYIRGASKEKIQMILRHPEVQEVIPSGSEFLFSTGPVDYNGVLYDKLYLVKKRVEFTGESLEGITPSTDQFRRPEVLFNVKSNYRARWGSVTGNNLQKPLAIILDGRVESAPTIENQITTSGKITMRSGASYKDAVQLSNVLKSGALPTRLIIREDVIVGPSLGRDSIRNGITASLLGLALVALFMIFYYRASGIVAVIALVFNLFVLMGVLAMLNRMPNVSVALTVPGVAGIVLLVGISVDAAVLIFERVREELRTGKTVRASIDAGYSRAAVAIVDSNITTLIVAIILNSLGSGPVKGFAVTLMIGILISLFSALVVTRTIFEFRKTYRKLSI